MVGLTYISKTDIMNMCKISKISTKSMMVHTMPERRFPMTERKPTFQEPKVTVYDYEAKDIITTSIELPESDLPVE